MLYETLSQPYIFALFFLTGFACGFLFDLKNVFSKILRKNNILTHFFNFFATFLTLLSYFFVNLKINYGQFRFFTIAFFLISFSFQRLLIAKLFTRCYNKFKEKHQNEKRKREKIQL